MKMRILEVHDGTEHGGVVFDYFLDIEFLSSGRNATVFWGYATTGKDLKTRVGKTIDGLLRPLVLEIHRNDGCENLVRVEGEILKGKVIGDIDMQSLFYNSDVHPISITNPHKTFPNYYGLDTADGTYVFGANPQYFGKLNTGEEICIWSGRMDIIAWSLA